MVLYEAVGLVGVVVRFVCCSLGAVVYVHDASGADGRALDAIVVSCFGVLGCGMMSRAERELAREIKRLSDLQRRARERWMVLDVRRNELEQRLGALLAARHIDREAMLSRARVAARRRSS